MMLTLSSSFFSARLANFTFKNTLMERVQVSERRNNLSVEDAINSLINDFQEAHPACDEILTRLLFNISPGMY